MNGFSSIWQKQDENNYFNGEQAGLQGMNGGKKGGFLDGILFSANVENTTQWSMKQGVVTEYFALDFL